MAVAGCINAYDCAGCFLTTFQQLQSDNIGVAINYTAPSEYWRRQLDYIKYTDKCGCTCCLTGENELKIVATQWVIKNFTLTNDDTNEKVIVKWNDLFGSNRAYTMVRYKTWSYPTSITDWTLAVKETTKNQYATNGYWVSWLSDDTTYYFSVFGVDTDGTVINVQSKAITTEFWWHPSANTFAYYSFDDRWVNWYIKDDSWNWRNATWWTQPSYVLVSWSNYAWDFYNPSSWNPPVADISWITNTKFTEVVRVKPVADWQQYISCIWWNYQQAIIYWYNSKQIEFYSYDWKNRRITIKSWVNLNQWYCIWFTRNWTTIKVYCNGEYVWSITVPTYTIEYINVWWTWWSVRFHWLIWSIILENNVEWSLSDFQSYYNKTKKHYQ